MPHNINVCHKYLQDNALFGILHKTQLAQRSRRAAIIS
jgi:hypothetical protein